MAGIICRIHTPCTVAALRPALAAGHRPALTLLCTPISPPPKVYASVLRHQHNPPTARPRVSSHTSSPCVRNPPTLLQPLLQLTKGPRCFRLSLRLPSFDFFLIADEHHDKLDDHA